MTIQEPSFRTIRPVEKTTPYFTNLQPSETMPNRDARISLTSKDKCQTITHAMPNDTPRMTIRPQAVEAKLVKLLQKKLGLKPGQIARLAIRRLAEAEGVKVAG